MSKVKIDIISLLRDFRLTITELSVLVGIPYVSLWQISKRGTIKLNTLKVIEQQLGDLSAYIIAEKVSA